MEFLEITFQCVHGSFYSSLIKVHLYTSSIQLFSPKRWNGEYHRASTYLGKSDNNEICSLNPFFGVIVLYPKSIPWALEFTNKFYKISSLGIYMYHLIPTFMDLEVWLSNPQVIPKAQLYGCGNLDICI